MLKVDDVQNEFPLSEVTIIGDDTETIKTLRAALLAKKKMVLEEFFDVAEIDTTGELGWKSTQVAIRPKKGGNMFFTDPLQWRSFYAICNELAARA